MEAAARQLIRGVWSVLRSRSHRSSADVVQALGDLGLHVETSDRGVTIRVGEDTDSQMTWEGQGTEVDALAHVLAQALGWLTAWAAEPLIRRLLTRSWRGKG